MGIGGEGRGEVVLSFLPDLISIPCFLFIRVHLCLPPIIGSVVEK